MSRRRARTRRRRGAGFLRRRPIVSGRLREPLGPCASQLLVHAEGFPRVDRAAQAVARVAHHLGQISYERAMAFLMHDVYGYSLEEIASTSGITVAAAQSRLVRGRRELHARIAADPEAFLVSLEDREAKGGPIALPDGSFARRVPGFRRWLWDGEICGAIGFRWQPGTAELPPHCLGHIGYSVVPWKQGRGYATQAVLQLLPEARELGLPYVEITTDPENLASQRVIEKAGGRFVERFVKPAQYGSKPGLRFRSTLRFKRRDIPRILQHPF